eukprot:176247-Prorocentrum_minimum.AAC.1
MGIFFWGGPIRALTWEYSSGVDELELLHGNILKSESSYHVGQVDVRPKGGAHVPHLAHHHGEAPEGGVDLGVPEHLQGAFKEHSRSIQGAFKEHSRRIQGAFKKDNRSSICRSRSACAVAIAAVCAALFSSATARSVRSSCGGAGGRGPIRGGPIRHRKH